MTRRIALITNDKSFEEYVKMTALTLTKLNYQVDIQKIEIPSANLIIIDFDDKQNLEKLKNIRKEKIFQNNKILGVLSDGSTDKKDLFEAGCDSIITKKEFEIAANNILMY